MNILIRNSLVVFVGALLCVFSADSNSVGKQGPMAFEDIDLDGDNKINQSEFNTAAASRAAGQKRSTTSPSAKFLMFDINGDGYLNAEELAEGRRLNFIKSNSMQNKSRIKKNRGRNNSPNFSEYDANSDNTISAKEFYDTRNKRMIEKASSGALMKNAGKAPSFEDIDLDGNGEINIKEFETHRALRMNKKR